MKLNLGQVFARLFKKREPREKFLMLPESIELPSQPISEPDEFKNIITVLSDYVDKREKIVIYHSPKLHTYDNLAFSDIAELFTETIRWYRYFKAGEKIRFYQSKERVALMDYFVINRRTRTYIDLDFILKESFKFWDEVEKSDLFKNDKQRNHYYGELKEDWRKVYELIYDFIYD